MICRFVVYDLPSFPKMFLPAERSIFAIFCFFVNSLFMIYLFVAHDLPKCSGLRNGAFSLAACDLPICCL